MRRKVFHIDFRVLSQESFDLSAFVPRCSIYIKINLPALDAHAQILQEGQEALAISFGPAEQTVPAVKWLHPTEEIQAFVVLARCGHDWLGASQGPDTAELPEDICPRFSTEFRSWEGEMPEPTSMIVKAQVADRWSLFFSLGLRDSCITIKTASSEKGRKLTSSRSRPDRDTSPAEQA